MEPVLGGLAWDPELDRYHQPGRISVGGTGLFPQLLRRAENLGAQCLPWARV